MGDDQEEKLMPTNELDELFSEITDEDKCSPPREIDEDMKI